MSVHCSRAIANRELNVFMLQMSVLPLVAMIGVIMYFMLEILCQDECRHLLFTSSGNLLVAG